VVKQADARPAITSVELARHDQPYERRIFECDEMRIGGREGFRSSRSRTDVRLEGGRRLDSSFPDSRRASAPPPRIETRRSDASRQADASRPIIVGHIMRCAPRLEGVADHDF